MQPLRRDQITSVIIICCCLLLYGSYDPVAHIQAAQEQAQEVHLRTSAPVPIRKSKKLDVSPIPEPILSASSAAVIDVNSGAILFQKNAGQTFLPASTTKLMTALVVRQNFGLNEVITVTSESTSDGTTIGLIPGEKLTVQSLLQAMLISSGNDAAEALANHYPGKQAAFVVEMNRKAEELNFTSTIFENPTGFDGIHHQTTARDLLLLAKEVMRDPVLAEIVATPATTITDTTGTIQHQLRSTNQLITDPTVMGIKTGTTEGAGQVLITQQQQDGRPIIVVIMGSLDRYSETQALIHWVREEYQWFDLDELIAPQ